ncbi:hypothetical protein Trydic_g15019 [Trypoxylus dichotomus]
MKVDRFALPELLCGDLLPSYSLELRTQLPTRVTYGHQLVVIEREACDVKPTIRNYRRRKIVIIVIILGMFMAGEIAIASQFLARLLVLFLVLKDFILNFLACSGCLLILKRYSLSDYSFLRDSLIVLCLEVPEVFCVNAVWLAGSENFLFNLSRSFFRSTLLERVLSAASVVVYWTRAAVTHAKLVWVRIGRMCILYTIIPSLAVALFLALLQLLEKLSFLSNSR